MLWLDRIVAADDHTIACIGSVRSDAPFVRAGRAASVVALEYMAQASAALLGMQAHRRGVAPVGGYLVGVPTFELFADDLAVGEALEVYATQIWPDAVRPAERLVSLECKVVRAGVAVALATLNVVRHDPHG
ncbi:MAG TPA: hypothetical protein VFG69_21375, partial [Nannocystaceae bacterium]|nr:hypothetical protein [Nannocystaceae bacterium]